MFRKLMGSSPVIRAFAIALVVLGAVLPFTAQSFTLMQFSYVLQLALAVLSLNLLTGLVGQVNLGQAAFVGLGAYTVVILNTTYSLTVLSASVIAIVVTAVVGLIVGLPSLRLRGLYVTLTSLGLAIIFPVIIQAGREHTGGTAGMALATPVTAPVWTGVDDAQWVYLVSFVVTVICCVLVRNLKNSRMGRALQASRDHETVGQAFGIRPSTIKLTTIALSSALAGLSGCLFAMQRQFVSPGDFTLLRAIDYFVGMALGGSTSILDPGRGVRRRVPRIRPAVDQRCRVGAGPVAAAVCGHPVARRHFLAWRRERRVPSSDRSGDRFGRCTVRSVGAPNPRRRGHFGELRGRRRAGAGGIRGIRLGW